MWCGILNTCLMDPYFFPHNTLNAKRYPYFLEFTLPDLLRDVPSETRNHLKYKYYQQDGAPACNARAIRRYTYLTSTCEEKWVRVLKPDLNPFHIFLRAFFKNGPWIETCILADDTKERIETSCLSMSAE